MFKLRTVEITFESIPGTTIQIMAIVRSSELDSIAILSLMSSIMTASFSATVMTYDLDTNFKKRTESPDLYGFIPNKRRRKALTLISLFIFSTCALIVRSLACALISTKDAKVMGLILGGECLIYIQYRAIRRDLIMWAPLHGMVIIPGEHWCHALSVS